jgi:acetolactate synthase-1/2/3 large subunit
VVQIIGDGGYHFSSPDSVYAVAQQYQIPIFTVVLDNGGWQAVKSAVQRVYPKGVAAETDQFQSRLRSGRQGEARDFSGVAQAFGAHGECVTEPDELAAAIDRCLAALDDGKAAVLHVHITPL